MELATVNFVPPILPDYGSPQANAFQAGVQANLNSPANFATLPPPPAPPIEFINQPFQPSSSGVVTGQNQVMYPGWRPDPLPEQTFSTWSDVASVMSTILGAGSAAIAGLYSPPPANWAGFAGAASVLLSSDPAAFVRVMQDFLYIEDPYASLGSLN